MPTSYGAQVPHSRGLQSAYKNRRKAPDLSLPTKAAQLPRGLQSTLKNKRKALDLSLPIITQGFNPGYWGEAARPRLGQAARPRPGEAARPRLGQAARPRLGAGPWPPPATKNRKPLSNKDLRS